jgi:multidrug efflux system outer membrane protein
MPRHALVLCSALLLAACQPPQDVTGSIDLPATFSRPAEPNAPESAARRAWWGDLADAHLDVLVERGLSDNISVRQAVARLAAAQAVSRAAGAANRPSLDLAADALRTGRNGGPHGWRTDASADFAWPFDLFGRYAALRASAEANKEAAAADIEAARLAYLAALVGSYVDLRYYDEAISLTRGNIASHGRTLRLVEEMRSGGVASDLDVAQTRALLESARADLPALQRDRDQIANRIATLVGDNATDFAPTLRQPGRILRVRHAVPFGVPADLLRDRPDIRREERRLAAAAADIGVARAQLYPSLTLTGNIDVAALIAGGVTSTTAAWAFGPSLTAPILDSGRLRAGVKLARANFRVQYLQWRGAVLTAVEEVENALVAAHRTKAQIAAVGDKVASLERARVMAGEGYRGGNASVLDLLDTERSLAAARLERAAALRQEGRTFVLLNVAIGSGAAFGMPELSSEPPAAPPPTVAAMTSSD